MNKSGRSIGFHELAQVALWSLLTLLAMLAYFCDIRPFIMANLGIYFSGLLDGILATIATIVIISYFASRT